MLINFKTVILFITIFSVNILAGDIRFCYITNGGRYINPYYGEASLVAVKTAYDPDFTPGLFGGFVKIFTDNGEYDSRYNIPQYLLRAPGNYIWRIELIEYNLLGEEVKTIRTVNFTVAFAVAGENNFDGGRILVDGNNVQSGTYVSKLPNEILNLSAIDQDYNNLPRLWTQNSSWYRARTGWTMSGAINRNLAYNVRYDDNLVNIIAQLKIVPNWPSVTPRNLTFSSNNQGILTLNWVEHPHVNVSQYKIWRKTNSESPELITTVNRGTTTYSDTRFRANGGATVYYDVRAYYSPESTTSQENWIATTGLDTEISKKNNFTDEQQITYALNNYPNPFNPSTRIEYDLPVSGHTTLKVYNSLGKEIATLVDDYRDKGKYAAEFNASDLSSGLYLCELKSGSFVQIKKMLLMK